LFSFSILVLLVVVPS